MSCGVHRRHSSDPMLLWLLRRPAATAPIRPLAWEPPYATSVSLKRHTHTHTQKVPLCMRTEAHTPTSGFLKVPVLWTELWTESHVLLYICIPTSRDCKFIFKVFKLMFKKFYTTFEVYFHSWFLPKNLAILPMLYNISLSLSYTNSLHLPFPLPPIAPPHW